MAEDAMTPDLIAFVREQKDRQEILDCLLRYTRGVDRHDKALMASAFYPDAYNDHGVPDVNAHDFCGWAISYHDTHQVSHHHNIGNVSIDLDGDIAHVETYYSYASENREGPPMLSFGRYADRLEKRDGKWAIAYRRCLSEITGTFNKMEIPEENASLLSTGPKRRDRRDVSYVRPLSRDTPHQ